MLTPLTLRLVAMSAISAMPLAACAQSSSWPAMASEKGKIVQAVAGTTISVDYYRPVARGRELFGRVVRWGDEWTPGANWATLIETDKDVFVEGKPLPKGKYTIWMIPQQTEWTVIFSKRAPLFHTQRPSSEDDQLRFTVKPDQGPHTEVLTWSFPMVTRDATVLQLQWGTVVIPLMISTNAARPMSRTAEERGRLIGAYTVAVENETGQTSDVHIEVIDTPNGLRLRGNPPAPGNNAELDLSSVGENQFHAAFFRRGQMFGIEPSDLLTFHVEGARATGFEVRNELGRIFARGRREK